MESTFESLVSKIQHLPKVKLREVSDFVEFLTWQESQKGQSERGDLEMELSDQEFETLADELTNAVGSNVTLLSDYAVSRAGIYEEHP